MKNLPVKINAVVLRLLVSVGAAIFAGASLLMFTSLLVSCQEPESPLRLPDALPADAAAAASGPDAFPYSGNLVDITSKHMDFILPEEIPSGWTTFRYHNQSHMVHFFVLEKMPVADGEQKRAGRHKSRGFPCFSAGDGPD
ncbi:hypothetical protein [Cesiribacter andamanensis]|uniref:Uncharacterized protein n=1 Tax=Cesiribacter andamanensis AMV16 TaxID=1279009 RepID=M7MZW2_9BACT|nr:hypothetical protein [Cesiribacter andamanensis]EMR01973.1 hypothetical protein ADICEAN_02908 [Cesiribacter andamanensis AMV16]